MVDMKVTQLNVDLLQDQATIAMNKQSTDQKSGKAKFSNVFVTAPVQSVGNQSEPHLKRIAVEEAKKVLREALETLERHDF